LAPLTQIILSSGGSSRCEEGSAESPALLVPGVDLRARHLQELLGPARQLVAVLLRSLLAVAIDEEGARVSGLPVPWLNGAVSMLAALTIGISMRIVGILLIAALMVLPVIAAQRVAWSLRSTMGISVALGLGSVLTGLTVSYYANLPPGGTIVLTATGLFLVAAAVEALRARA
jgi:zinc transport system permease protein